MMKRSVISTFTFLLVTSLTLITPEITQAQPTPPQFSVGQKFTAPGLSFPENTYIVNVQQGDVTGDKTKDVVLLVGQKDSSSDTRYSQLNVVVYDGKKRAFSTITDPQINGYLSGFSPKMFLGDFTGDKVQDVMVSVATGGSGGVYANLVTSWLNNKSTILFGAKENEGLQIKGNFENGFMAKLRSDVLKKTFQVDVSANKTMYIQGNIYDARGKYIYKDPDNRTGYSIFSDQFGPLVPVDTDKNGVYELAGTQYVWGPIHTYGVTNVESLWKYSKKKFEPVEAKYTVWLLMQQ